METSFIQKPIDNRVQFESDGSWTSGLAISLNGGRCRATALQEKAALRCGCSIHSQVERDGFIQLPGSSIMLTFTGTAVEVVGDDQSVLGIAPSLR